MTTERSVIPTSIERGLRCTQALSSSCEIEGVPTFDASAKRWIVTILLRIGSAGPFVGTSTKWRVFLDETYPYGSIAFYPSAEGGLTATFPHQERNQADKDGRGWRGGKLCLDSPLRGERRPVAARDPIGDADTRLRWHVERALDWLDAAAAGRLLAAGDPFELPWRPYTALKEWSRRRVVHDETAAEFKVWAGRERTIGVARLAAVVGIENAIAVAGFDERDGIIIRSWGGRPLGPGAEHLSAVWWVWPNPIVIQPWQCPGTWGELRRAGKAMRVDVDAALKQLAPRLRGTQTRTLLLLGYPIPTHVGEAPSEMHWDALLLPRLPAAAGKAPSGFRPNSKGWWRRDRHGAFGDDVPLEYLHAEDWSGERLQARGRLPKIARAAHIVILGAGALGASLAELLVRAGLTNIALIDGDVVAAGNVCRHSATLVDLDKPKVKAVGQRLLQVSPHVRVTEIDRNLAGDERAIVEALDPYDVIIDCTASEDAITALAAGWWSVPRTFASFSMGFGGRRLFSFGMTAHQYPHQAFRAAVEPWLKDETITWAGAEELLEGAGCWSPLFPACYDDIVMSAAVCVKELERLVTQRPREPHFRVFERQDSTDGFTGFSICDAPALAADAAVS